MELVGSVETELVGAAGLAQADRNMTITTTTVMLRFMVPLFR
jgi:hypothetical protein